MANGNLLNLPSEGVARTDLILLSLFTAIQSAGFFSAALPSVFTIDRFAQDDRARQKLVEGQQHAWLLSIGMGVVVSILVKSILPILFTMLIALSFSVMYNTAISRSMVGAPGFGNGN